MFCYKSKFNKYVWTTIFYQAPILGFIFCFALAQCLAQGGADMTGTGGKHTIKGRLYFPSGRPVDQPIKVRLDGTNTGGLSVIVGPTSNGEFTFSNLGPGSYTLVVEGGNEYENASEAIYIEGTSNFNRTMPDMTSAKIYNVPVYLQYKRTRNEAGDMSKPGVLNVELNNVPKPAVELYEKGVAEGRTGDSKKAIEDLNSAIALYPSFPLALNELGVQYLKSGQTVKAIEALRSAVKFSPNAFQPRLNLGIALLNDKKFADAETQLREAVSKNNASWTAHMYLGIALINLHNYSESEIELQRAVTSGGEGVGKAHYYLGGIYWRQKDYVRAANELEQYLRLTPKAPDAERVRSTITELRSKQ